MYKHKLLGHKNDKAKHVLKLKLLARDKIYRYSNFLTRIEGHRLALSQRVPHSMPTAAYASI